MEKKTPHYSLSAIKELIRKGCYQITATARDSAYHDFGLGEEDIINLIITTHINDFYKSMTTRADPRIWQDVYHVGVGGAGTAYAKLQIHQGSTIIISLKKR